MAKSKFKLLVYAGLLLVLLFGLVTILPGLSGKAFSLELLGLAVLVLLSLIGCSGYRTFGERVLFFVFLLYLVNLVLIWYFVGTLYVVLLIVTLGGFLLASPRKQKKTLKITRSTEPFSQVFDPVETKKQKKEPLKNESKSEEAEEKTGEKKGEEKKELSTEKSDEVQERQASVHAEKNVKKAKVTYNPGKFVASKNSNNYHEPKCDWAKKIAVSRRVWFKSKEEAWEKGFKAHSCIES